MQPPSAPPQWSPDGMWWWDGARWIPRAQPAGKDRYAPTPTARVVVIVALAVAVVLTGLLGIVGTLGVTGGDRSATSIILWLVFVLAFLLSAAALAGVLLRKEWGRWIAVVTGALLSLTFCGAVVGLPIIFGAVRMPSTRAS